MSKPSVRDRWSSLPAGTIIGSNNYNNIQWRKVDDQYFIVHTGPSVGKQKLSNNTFASDEFFVVNEDVHRPQVTADSLSSAIIDQFSFLVTDQTLKEKITKIQQDLGLVEAKPLVAGDAFQKWEWELLPIGAVYRKVSAGSKSLENRFIKIAADEYLIISTGEIYESKKYMSPASTYQVDYILETK